MTYVQLGSFSGNIPSITENRRRPSVIAAIDNRRPEVVFADQKKIEAAYEARLDRSLARLKRMDRMGERELAGLASFMEPFLPYGTFGQSPQDGAATVNQFKELLAGALQELKGIPKNEQVTMGRHLLISRAANASAELGFAITARDLAITSLNDLMWFTQQTGGDIEGLTADYNGRQMATSYADQGEKVSTLRAVGQSLERAYGATGGMSGMAAIAEGTGMRGLIEGAMGQKNMEAAGRYLNSATLGKAIGAVKQVAGAIQSAKPGAIVTAVGSTIALAGAAIPGPVGAIVSAVGAVVSMIGMLIDWLLDREPMPPLVQCIQPNADAWACLRLYLTATRPNLPDTIGIQDLRVEGWDVQPDIFTGEVMVKMPGEQIYRRILDVFDRAKLLQWYTEGDLKAWIEGKRIITDAYTPIGSASLGGGRGLYCLTPDNEAVGRYICADYTSSAVRFRTHTEKGKDSPISAWKGHGPKVLGETLRDSGFEKAYRAGLFTSAFLAGTPPYGRVVLKGGESGICTGIGGSYEGIPSEGTLKVKRPVMIRWDSANKDILVIPPTLKRASVAGFVEGAVGKKDRDGNYPVENPASAAVTLLSWKNYATFGKEFFQRVLSDGTFRMQNRIPSPSPAAVNAPSATTAELAASVGVSVGTASTTSTTRPVPTVVRRALQQTSKSSSATGMSTGTKIGIGLGAAAVLTTGGILLYRKLRKN